MTDTIAEDSEPASVAERAKRLLKRHQNTIISTMAAVGAVLLVAVAQRQVTAEDDEAAADPSSTDTTPKWQRPRSWSGPTRSSAGYDVCGHCACAKKVNQTITHHDCCGRCQVGRDCLKAALRDYDGPGGWPHRCHAGILHPGVCIFCGEPCE